MYPSGKCDSKREDRHNACQPPAQYHAVLPEHVLISHRSHCFIVDAQLNFICVAVSVLMKTINCIVSAAYRLAMMIEHSIELVMRWL
jgi:hypothetical protein